MNRIFEKWFCKHKWKIHFTKEVTIETFKENLFSAKFDSTGVKRTFIREVLICTECGKIKTIEY